MNLALQSCEGGLAVAGLVVLGAPQPGCAVLPTATAAFLRTELLYLRRPAQERQGSRAPWDLAPAGGRHACDALALLIPGNDYGEGCVGFHFQIKDTWRGLKLSQVCFPN